MRLAIRLGLSGGGGGGGVQTSRTISAGTGLTGGGDLSANRTLALATAGAGAVTYTSPSSLTVDAYGRVTAAASGSGGGGPTFQYLKSQQLGGGSLTISTLNINLEKSIVQLTMVATGGVSGHQFRVISPVAGTPGSFTIQALKLDDSGNVSVQTGDTSTFDVVVLTFP